jgi:alkylhydroperoxidase family enzyme
MADYTAAELEPALRALLDYCVAITRDPRSGSAAGVDGLRVLGWSDEAIHDALQVTGFFNYYDRLADGLGVDPEPRWSQPSS